ncbi:uncharacterized protein LOC132200729 [Neocloeon triangulifer]|uniref:uncharacterized protein LOC132200729 n=1 Tax=Neocloeon triangulifer TaxID=2078957 RepID=UPI00286F1B94|nr:uncharacterized protein LOC132200729 [Neocloeon triangulifer]
MSEAKTVARKPKGRDEKNLEPTRRNLNKSDEAASSMSETEQFRPASEGQRAISPSSVSSAASMRPLEWDSGADVGYLLQNEERQLANAIKKLGLGLASSGPPSKSEEAHKEALFANQKSTIDSLREDEVASVPLLESTPKVGGLQVGSLAGSRQTLPKTASSSSVATVVSKEERPDARSTDLISDLTKGLHLVKSLIADAKGDKEKQGKLLAHVVKQLKTVEEGRHHRRRSKAKLSESTQTSTAGSSSSSNSSNVVEMLKNSYRSQKLSASGDSSATLSTAQSDVDEACQRLLSSMSNPDNDRLLAFANSEERLAKFPPDPKLEKVLGFDDNHFAAFMQEYINRECQRQACWRSDVLNLMSKRAEIVKDKKKQDEGKSRDSSSSTTSLTSTVSDKIEKEPSNLFQFTMAPSGKPKKVDLEPKAKIFQHTIAPSSQDIARAKVGIAPPRPSSSKASSNLETVPKTLDDFLSDPNKLTLFKPAVVEKAKKKARSPASKSTKDPPIRDWDLPLQELLKKRRPNFIKRAENRRKCLALLGERRQQRGNVRRQCLKEQVDKYSGSLPENIKLEPLPPPPLAEMRLFSQQKLREHTAKVCRKLEENRKKEEAKKLEEEHKMNRLMAQIFKRKLQNRVLHHKVDLSNSMSVITSED